MVVKAVVVKAVGSGGCEADPIDSKPQWGLHARHRLIENPTDDRKQL